MCNVIVGLLYSFEMMIFGQQLKCLDLNYFVGSDSVRKPEISKMKQMLSHNSHRLISYINIIEENLITILVITDCRLTHENFKISSTSHILGLFYDFTTGRKCYCIELK